mmetsp:Transcript_11055/g.17028  ORF Transcript_11055/g.17028 Transcript_11055/m.17028 type:complete len:212 (-) Transcript_11055:333-968(-)
MPTESFDLSSSRSSAEAVVGGKSDEENSPRSLGAVTAIDVGSFLSGCILVETPNSSNALSGVDGAAARPLSSLSVTSGAASNPIDSNFESSTVTCPKFSKSTSSSFIPLSFSSCSICSMGDLFLSFASLSKSKFKISFVVSLLSINVSFTSVPVNPNPSVLFSKMTFEFFSVSSGLVWPLSSLPAAVSPIQSSLPRISLGAGSIDISLGKD